MRTTTALKTVLQRINCIEKTPVHFFVDNEPAVSMITSLGGTRMRKTIPTCHHYLQQTIADALVNFSHLRRYLGESIEGPSMLLDGFSHG